MGNKGKKSTSSSKKTNKTQMLEKLMQKTLTELCSDLSFVDGNAAQTLSRILKGKSEHEVFSLLQDENSSLVKCIPVEILSYDPSGKKYLDVLSLVQRGLSPKPVVVEKFNSKNNEIVVSNRKIDTGKPSAAKLDETANAFFSKLGMQGDDLRQLITSVIEESDLDLEKMMESKDIPSMLETFTKISGVFQKKIDSGEVDVEKITNQVQTMMAKMQQDPEIASTLANATQNTGNVPDLSSLMSMMGGTTGSTENGVGIDMSSLSSLMQMMSPASADLD